VSATSRRRVDSICCSAEGSSDGNLATDDAAQPGGERRGLCEAGEAAPRRDEGLLDHVVRHVDVAEHGQRAAVGEPLVLTDERREGIDVAGPGLLHERHEIHGSPFDGHPSVPPATSRLYDISPAGG
jgi:hypothetical protein